MTQRRIAILGSTGSIGVQTLNVIRRHRERYVVEVLTAGNNGELLIEQAQEFEPNVVVIADKGQYKKVNEALSKTGVKVFAGEESICEVVKMSTVDLVVSAIVGFAGLRPTMSAIEAGKPVALANKETLVAGGEIVIESARKRGVSIIPVDSEHSAIFQCLQGESGIKPHSITEAEDGELPYYYNEIDKLILTASGGPFRGKKLHDLKHVSVAEALCHPNWKMGAKVTIDSATLMNKGLEVIEAKWLFGVDVSKIEVLVHPQSIVHSMVQFRDGSIKAQMGVASMELPIQYALSYPERLESHVARFDFGANGNLTFMPPDRETFQCLPLAYAAIERGGNIPCAMNAANEVVVNRFIAGKVAFTEIPILIEKALKETQYVKKPTIDDLVATDREVRKRMAEEI